MNIFELPRDEFLAMLPELAQQGVDTDELLRKYRSANSAFSGLNQAVDADAQRMAESGRRPVLGGFFSKEIGTTGWDAMRSLQSEFTSGVRGGLSGAGRAFEAPAMAARGLIPMQDMGMEALGTAGMASLGGAAMTRPRGSVGMGGRVAGEALPEPRNAAERMARDILDMRAQGRAGEVTDDMMAQADPQYMFSNTPLPMDESSRLARAGDAGFDVGTPLYHGSTARQDFAALEPSNRGRIGPGVYMTPDENLASVFAGSDRASIIAKEPALPNSRVMPLIATNNPADEAARAIAGNARREVGLGGDEGRLAFQRALGDFDGVSMPTERTILDPRNIRSRFARFDPEFSHLSNLSAANASPLAGIAGLSAEDQAVIAGMDDPQEIEDYIAQVKVRGGFADGYNMTTDIRQLYSGR